MIVLLDNIYNQRLLNMPGSVRCIMRLIFGKLFRMSMWLHLEEGGGGGGKGDVVRLLPNTTMINYPKYE